MTPPSLLLPQILTKAQKRHYPSYTYARTLSLFPTRGSLVAYEKALALETEVDDALGEQETLNGRRPFSKHFEGKAIFGNAMGRKEGAEVVRAIWRLVWERWKGEVEAAQRDGLEKEGARTVKDRFQPGEDFFLTPCPPHHPFLNPFFSRSRTDVPSGSCRTRPDEDRVQRRVRARRLARLRGRVHGAASAARPEGLAAGQERVRTLARLLNSSAC